MCIDKFVEYLKNERRLSDSSLGDYKRDIKDFQKYCKIKGTEDLKEVIKADIVAYLLYLQNNDKSIATINRRLSAIRLFYGYLFEKELISINPTTNIKALKVERKQVEYLTVEEIEKLLDAPDITLKGKRDKAMLEILYATGIRVNELIAADIEDINLRIGFFTCPGDVGKARIVPLGKHAREAVEVYLNDVRDMLVKNDRSERALFVNYYGKRMTRQGVWKLLKGYGQKAKIDKRLTPHILRNSFAVHMLQNGADLKSLQELLGNENIIASEIYLSVTKNRIKDVYDKTHPRA